MLKDRGRSAAASRTDSKMIPLIVVPGIFGDYDYDTDVHLDDFTWFADCMLQLEPSEQCLTAFNDDGDQQVTLADFSAFQIVFTGP
ncbi:MAG TPA: hypothetical protein VM243_06785 [Phycisphaerae bacterium]|nr:hypothetical protein [Phycisphaerae bacterium]